MGKVCRSAIIFGWMDAQFLAGHQFSVIYNDTGTEFFLRITVGDGDRKNRSTGLLCNQGKTGFKAEQVSVFGTGTFREDTEDFLVLNYLNRGVDRG